MADTTGGAQAQNSATSVQADQVDATAQEPKIKKSRTNTPWTPAEELRLKQMRDAGNSWSEIAKVGMVVCRDRPILPFHTLVKLLLLLTPDLRPSHNEQKGV
jgi:hypothetical protein